MAEDGISEKEERGCGSFKVEEDEFTDKLAELVIRLSNQKQKEEIREDSQLLDGFKEEDHRQKEK